MGYIHNTMYTSYNLSRRYVIFNQDDFDHTAVLYVAHAYIRVDHCHHRDKPDQALLELGYIDVLAVVPVGTSQVSVLNLTVLDTVERGVYMCR